MTEEEYDALDAMPLRFDEHGSLPARLPNGKPTPSAEVLHRLQGVGLITLLHDRWALTRPWENRKSPDRNRGS